MNKPESFIRNFFSLLSGNVIAQVLPLLFAPVLSRMFTEEEFALQANFLAIISLISIIAGGRYEFAIVLPKLKKDAVNLLMLAIKIAIVVTILSFGIIFFGDSISRFYDDNRLENFLFVIPFGILFTALNSIIIQWLVREKSFNKISIVKIVQAIFINSSMIVLGYFSLKSSGLIYGWCLGMIFTAILAFYFMKSSVAFSLVNKNKTIEVAKQYKEFPLINSLHAFTDVLFSQFLLFAIITKEFGLLYLGLFFMMNKYLRAPIKVIGSAVGQVYYREANEKHLNGQQVLSTLLKSVKIVLYFAIPICAIIILFGPDIFRIYLGDKWTQSGHYARIMAIPVLFNFIVAPISSTPLIFKKQKWAFLISVIGYASSILALEIGVWMNLKFEYSLMLFAGALSIYYLFLLFWYMHLTRS